MFLCLMSDVGLIAHVAHMCVVPNEKAVEYKFYIRDWEKKVQYISVWFHFLITPRFFYNKTQHLITISS